MILVLNLGLKSLRVVVFDRRGERVFVASREVETHLDGEKVEQEAEEWWRVAVVLFREAMAMDGIRRGLSAVTVTTSACNLVCEDERGGVLGKAMLVADKRAAGEAEELGRGERWVGRMDASMTAPRLRWLQEHEPERWRAARRFLTSNGWLVGRLTGRAVTDPLDAAKAGYDVDAGEYPEGLLESLGLGVDRLTPVVPMLTVAGVVQASVAEAVGMDGREVPVVVTGYDAVCGVFGTGGGMEGVVCDVSGTVTSLRVAVASVGAVDDGIQRQWEGATGRFLVGGSNNLGGGLVEWLRQGFYGAETEAYGMMEREAVAAGPAAGGLVFLPYLMGERAPLWDDEVRGVFFGLERRHGRREMARAVMEGCALATAALFDPLQAAVGSVERIRLSGGLTRIPLVTQLKADVLGMAVEVNEEFESTALGAAILRWIALGVLGSAEEAAGLIRVRETVWPREHLAGVYRELMALQQELYASCRPLFARRRDLMARLPAESATVVSNL
ncbi:MAG: xylulokinase [Verrucomicrobiota bacterium]